MGNFFSISTSFDGNDSASALTPLLLLTKLAIVSAEATVLYSSFFITRKKRPLVSTFLSSRATEAASDGVAAIFTRVITVTTSTPTRHAIILRLVRWTA
ncbi:hypothetical protein JG687_00012271 [Phytophthora cactorum]|uniref:Uncharacterized protein n=1 Tax=Phytophthora cactorum TaxID=29920 RepID=A0A329S4W3_9STRA|nr:hypothetical protein Pcac1_g4138 [Phytophthora cactorum]KAG2799723.1 hypothetical protein PC112_g20779 [Phytophthora cactorum]KAG2838404.1 hypothetical protein PC111_g4249 [Phytophthora cactorum]KAG2845748.1 hypothetical protein PC113_g18119 [Phytophthora cactorum]KAG2878653.1 hypothetical protein PC114_g22985 [Phytophthora cactorum]